MKPVSLFLPALLAMALCGCVTVETPRGTSRGYMTARFVQTRPKAIRYSRALEDSPEINKMIQDAIASQFSANGIPMTGGDADLIVAYMIVRQNNVSTTMNQDYFGHGRDAQAILREAHTRGVVNRTGPDAFEAGAILVDVLDARTNKLVYRNFAKRGLLREADDATRKRRINEAVAEALAPFFR